MLHTPTLLIMSSLTMDQLSISSSFFRSLSSVLQNSMTTHPLLRSSTTHDDAVEGDDNIAQQPGYVPTTEQLYQSLWDRRYTVYPLTKHHVGLGQHESRGFLPCLERIRGNFYVCISVEVETAESSK